MDEAYYTFRSKRRGTSHVYHVLDLKAIFVQLRLWVNVRKHMDGSYPMQIASEIFTSSCSSLSCVDRGVYIIDHNGKLGIQDGAPPVISWFINPIT